MTKEEFLTSLNKKLVSAKVSKGERESSRAFYDEAISDRVESGLSEAMAIGQMGDTGDIVDRIVAEIPPVPRAIARADTGSKTLNIILLVILSPIWAPLALALACCVLAVYVSIWATVAALWACVVALLLCGPLGIVIFVLGIADQASVSGLWSLGAGMAACGLGIFAFFGTRRLTAQLMKLTARFARWVGHFFVKDDGAIETETETETETEAEAETESPLSSEEEADSRSITRKRFLVTAVMLVVAGIVCVLAAWVLSGYDLNNFQTITLGPIDIVSFSMDL